MSGWGALWDVITGKAQAESDAADAKLAALNQQQLDSGAWDQATYDNVTSAHLAANTTGMNTYAETGQAFVQGAAEGLNNEATAVNNTLNKVAGGAVSLAWKALPWWVWLAGILFLLAYVGLLGPLLGAGRKKILASL
jgi:hypothetical protein